MTPWLILATLAGAVAGVLAARTAGPGPGLRRDTGPLLRPVEALHVVEAHCLAEHRPTIHVRFACGELMCLDCRTEGDTR